MALVSHLLACLALLQVVEAPVQNISAVTQAKSVEVKLVGLDKRLCDSIEPPALPRINIIFLFITPPAVCTPSQTTLTEFMASSDKILTYSRNNTKCNLRKKEGTIIESNSSTITTVPSHVVVVLVNNMLPREWNKSMKKERLYQKVRIYADTV